MSCMDFGRTEEVVAVALVSAEKLDARKSRPNTPHASHIEGTLDEGHVLCQRQR